ncbi:MAG: glycine zipper 2TM domain-containing protein [Xanthomonadales bacterium]|nr:glycine zipper 2TM domain-containing protein [Xanthomonadales bacterium]
MRCSHVLLVSAFGLAASFIAPPVAAQYGGSYGEPMYDWAEVVRVDPIVRAVDQPVYQNQCWDEPVTYREPPRYVRHRGPRAPAVLGGIIGGVIGNQFGHGSGRDAATMAGAMLGYSAVRDSQYYGGHYQGGREFTRYERRCEPRTDYRRDEQVTGYEVTYRYQGRLYQTVTDYPPGPNLRVRVDINPVP